MLSLLLRLQRNGPPTTAAPARLTQLGNGNKKNTGGRAARHRLLGPRVRAAPRGRQRLPVRSLCARPLHGHARALCRARTKEDAEQRGASQSPLILLVLVCAGPYLCLSQRVCAHCRYEFFDIDQYFEHWCATQDFLNSFLEFFFNIFN